MPGLLLEMRKTNVRSNMINDDVSTANVPNIGPPTNTKANIENMFRTMSDVVLQEANKH